MKRKLEVRDFQSKSLLFTFLNLVSPRGSFWGPCSKMTSPTWIQDVSEITNSFWHHLQKTACFLNILWRVTHTLTYTGRVVGWSFLPQIVWANRITVTSVPPIRSCKARNTPDAKFTTHALVQSNVCNWGFLMGNGSEALWEIVRKRAVVWFTLLVIKRQTHLWRSFGWSVMKLGF